jgi:hypothetical protein
MVIYKYMVVVNVVGNNNSKGGGSINGGCRTRTLIFHLSFYSRVDMGGGCINSATGSSGWSMLLIRGR